MCPNRILLTLNDDETIALTQASILEEQTDITNSSVKAIELYKNENAYELHLLVIKTDENLLKQYYYVTYAFKDMKIL